jgi:hypothetical protein
MKNGVFWDVTPCGSLRTDVSEELSASFIRVTRIGELGTILVVTSNRHTTATRRNIPEDTIHQRGREIIIVVRVEDVQKVEVEPT